MSDEFFIGIGVGFAIALVFWIASIRTYDRYLIRKAASQYRTPVCIRGQFFYLMPESEYVQEYERLRRREDMRRPGYMGDVNGPGCDPDVP